MRTRTRLALLATLATITAGCAVRELRMFPDRPVAWHEHDDTHVARQPAKRPSYAWTLVLRDSLARTVDDALALRSDSPAADVNALDEVPCSTWFCPRNHLRPLSLDEIAAGPPGVSAPVPPLTVMRRKTGGKVPGFVIEDSRGETYIVKFDPIGHVGLSSGADSVGSRLAHAAGWNVPGSFVIRLQQRDLRLDARADLDANALHRILLDAAQLPDGALSGMAVPFLKGEILGDIDLAGRRSDDPNDRIPHEQRRSLRASRVFMAWLNVADATQLNTLDSFVEEGGRRFVRHYLIDFGSALGAWGMGTKGLIQGREQTVDAPRTLKALVALGGYERGWQQERGEYARARAGLDPAVGYFPSEGWDPDSFRPIRRMAAYERMTNRDAYWGAKIVTSFTDAQIAAVVATGQYEPDAAREIARILRVRRDIIGRRYLATMTAVERPTVAGELVCFQDVAIARGYARRVAYRFRTTDLGSSRTVAHGDLAAAGAKSCLRANPGAATGRGYRVVRVVSHVDGRPSRGANIHLSWRAGERRWVVVGLDRDE